MKLKKCVNQAKLLWGNNKEKAWVYLNTTYFNTFGCAGE